MQGFGEIKNVTSQPGGGVGGPWPCHQMTHGGGRGPKISQKRVTLNGLTTTTKQIHFFYYSQGFRITLFNTLIFLFYIYLINWLDTLFHPWQDRQWFWAIYFDKLRWRCDCRTRIFLWILIHKIGKWLICSWIWNLKRIDPVWRYFHNQTHMLVSRPVADAINMTIFTVKLF